MSGSPYNGVNVSLLDCKINADPMQLLSRNPIQYASHHLAMHLFSKLAIYYNGSLAFMKSGWI